LSQLPAQRDDPDPAPLIRGDPRGHLVHFRAGDRRGYPALDASFIDHARSIVQVSIRPPEDLSLWRILLDPVLPLETQADILLGVCIEKKIIRMKIDVAVPVFGGIPEFEHKSSGPVHDFQELGELFLRPHQDSRAKQSAPGDQSLLKKPDPSPEKIAVFDGLERLPI